MAEEITNTVSQEEAYEFQYSPESIRELNRFHKKRYLHIYLPPAIVMTALFLIALLGKAEEYYLLMLGTLSFLRLLPLIRILKLDLNKTFQGANFRYTISPEKIRVDIWDDLENKSSQSFFPKDIFHYLDLEDWYILYDKRFTHHLKKSILSQNSSLPKFLQNIPADAKKNEILILAQSSLYQFVFPAAFTPYYMNLFVDSYLHNSIGAVLLLLCLFLSITVSISALVLTGIISNRIQNTKKIQFILCICSIALTAFSALIVFQTVMEIFFPVFLLI